MARSAKGADYERATCRLLSLWWTEGQRDDVFWRSSMSGGRATVRGKQGKQTAGHCGDIAATDPTASPFTKAVTVELKRGYSASSFADALDRPKLSAQQPWEAFVEQADIAHKLAGSFAWLLIQRRDKRQAMAFMPIKLFKALNAQGAFEARPYPFLTLRAKVRVTDTRGVIPVTVVAMTLTDFLKEAKPAHFLELRDGS